MKYTVVRQSIETEGVAVVGGYRTITEAKAYLRLLRDSCVSQGYTLYKPSALAFTVTYGVAGLGHVYMVVKDGAK